MSVDLYKEHHIEENYIDTPNGRIHYGSKGSGDVTLLCIPGGPGMGIYSLFPLFKLASENLRVVIYDQLGVGKSDNPDISYYSMENYVREIDILRKRLELDKVILLGHSFGDFILNRYLVDNLPLGVKGAIHYSGGGSLEIYLEQVHKLIEQLPEQTRQLIKEGDQLKQYTTPEYLEAVKTFRSYYANRIPFQQRPEEFFAMINQPYSSASEIMWGPSDWVATGKIEGYEVLEQLKESMIPHLILNGKYDMCTPKSCQYMAQQFKDAKQYIFEKSSHVSHWEQPEEFFEKVLEFIREIV